MKSVLINENNFTVSRVGSALEADKKINLALKISVIVHGAKASWTTAQGRPVAVRGDGLPPAGGMSLARSASCLWAVEFRLYPLAALVPVRIVGELAAGVGAESPRQAAVFRRQPRQGASGWKQSRWWSAKSGDGAYQGRPEHQAQRLGGRSGTACQFEFGPGTIGRCQRSARRAAPAVAGNDDSCRQRLRQRRLPGAVAAVGKPGLHSTPLQPTPTGQLAPRLLPKTAQGRELIPTPETLQEDWNAI